jgi:hypothetical protein
MRTVHMLTICGAALTIATAARAQEIDWKKVDEAFGHSPAVVGVRGAIRPPSVQITPVGPMGAANAINFQPIGGGKAAITGDFLVTGEEVNPLIRMLRANGIEVTAIHSHMLTEQPRMIFIHFWAKDESRPLHQADAIVEPDAVGQQFAELDMLFDRRDPTRPVFFRII